MKATVNKKYLWDYELTKNWEPQNEAQWLWFLERKINYGDWRGLNKAIVKKHFPQLKKRLDPGKRMMLEFYFKKYA